MNKVNTNFKRLTMYECLHVSWLDPWVTYWYYMCRGWWVNSNLYTKLMAGRGEQLTSYV